jgi:general stress protein YciG
MNPDRQREIARKGGKAAHEKGTAHQFSSEEAREAGRKGGQVVSRHREHMVEIGRSGGKARRRRRADTGGATHQPGDRASMPENIPEQSVRDLTAPNPANARETSAGSREPEMSGVGNE